MQQAAQRLVVLGKISISNERYRHLRRDQALELTGVIGTQRNPYPVQRFVAIVNYINVAPLAIPGFAISLMRCRVDASI